MQPGELGRGFRESPRLSRGQSFYGAEIEDKLT
jgi:hypothetical protein